MIVINSIVIIHLESKEAVMHRHNGLLPGIRKYEVRRLSDPWVVLESSMLIVMGQREKGTERYHSYMGDKHSRGITNTQRHLI